jgi:hypothetical protein
MSILTFYSGNGGAKFAKKTDRCPKLGAKPPMKAPRCGAARDGTSRCLNAAGGVPPSLFQKEIHAVEVDYTVTVVERIHPEDTADSCATLLQREIR